MGIQIRRNGGLTLHLTDNTKKFLNLFKINQHRTLKKIGEFIVGKMKYYVAVDTGNLRSRCNYKVTIFGKNLIFGNDADYAVYQEYGLRSRPNYTFTPFMRPAVNNHISEINSIAGRTITNGIR